MKLGARRVAEYQVYYQRELLTELLRYHWKFLGPLYLPLILINVLIHSKSLKRPEPCLHVPVVYGNQLPSYSAELTLVKSFSRLRVSLDRATDLYIQGFWIKSWQLYFPSHLMDDTTK